MSATTATMSAHTTLASSLSRFLGLALVGALALGLSSVAQAAPSAADLTTLKSNLASCSTGLSLLSTNLYAYPAKVDVATGGKRAWKEVYAEFTTTYLPTCNSVGTFLGANKGNAGLAAYEAQLATDGVTSWADYFTGSNGIVPGSTGLIGYCPQAHKAQFDCVSVPTRIADKIAKLGKQATNITAVYAPPASVLTQAKADGSACRAGMALMSTNMYAYPAKVDVATGGKRAWKDVYSEFKTASLPSCNAVGTFLTSYKGYPSLATVESTITSSGASAWSDYFTGRTGVQSIGDRIGAYCPNAHLAQYDCVRASTDDTTTIRNATAVLDLISAL